MTNLEQIKMQLNGLESLKNALRKHIDKNLDPSYNGLVLELTTRELEERLGHLESSFREFLQNNLIEEDKDAE